MKIQRIDTKKDMIAFAKKHGLTDWHEPEMKAQVWGSMFDNAGFWGESHLEFVRRVSKDMKMRWMFTPKGNVKKDSLEMWVRLFVNNEPVADVNLATLFAMASDGVK